MSEPLPFIIVVGIRRTGSEPILMSAIGRKADIGHAMQNVRFGPNADMGFPELLLR